MNKRRIYGRVATLAFFILLVAVATAGCGGQETSGPQAVSGAEPAAASSPQPEETSKSNDGTVIRIGIQGKSGIFNYAQETKWFERAFEPDGVKVEWVEFTSGPPHFEAIASNRLDFGWVGGTPVIAGQTGGIDFKAIAVVDDGKSNGIVVPKGSAIKKLEDLKGKTVAVAKGSSAYNFLFQALSKAGLTGDDIRMIQLQPDEARAAFDTGGVDAWAIWESYLTTAVIQSEATVLARGSDLGIVAPSFLIARTAFGQEHADLTVRFLEAYRDLNQYIKDHLDEVAETIATSQGLDLTIIRPVLQQTPFLFSPITPDYAKAHQAQADFLFKAGAIKKQLDTSVVIDNSFIERLQP
ncbi:aliphatic sulfonate ABC transporter substrate-binding protein [Paenibacillus aurantiacus]|uniref:Aliphatic sulfonate ABC transporter substrate-binding protein n=1 Tax=Paenibacillus aurantiacus TaxID=1936118 RepID=A0ABV5KTA0_9BACL